MSHQLKAHNLLTRPCFGCLQGLGKSSIQSFQVCATWHPSCQGHLRCAAPLSPPLLAYWDLQGKPIMQLPTLPWTLGSQLVSHRSAAFPHSFTTILTSQQLVYLCFSWNLHRAALSTIPVVPGSTGHVKAAMDVCVAGSRLPVSSLTELLPDSLMS